MERNLGIIILAFASIKKLGPFSVVTPHTMPLCTSILLMRASPATAHRSNLFVRPYPFIGEYCAFIGHNRHERFTVRDLPVSNGPGNTNIHTFGTNDTPAKTWINDRNPWRRLSTGRIVLRRWHDRCNIKLLKIKHWNYKFLLPMPPGTTNLGLFC